MVNLLFGIPELDRMLDLKSDHFYPHSHSDQNKLGEQGPDNLPKANSSITSDDDNLTSLSLLGPDGTGKSVLALHLVSRYFADSESQGESPRILYVSTDLRVEKARKIWQNFGLNVPYDRDIPCERASDRRERKKTLHRALPSFELIRLRPIGKEVADFLGPEAERGIGFLDLAASSAGDDWGYMTRAIGLLEGKVPGHLVIIDSVAGFETLTGETDAYGEQSTRRARIANVMRIAQNCCHIVFIVEEAQEGTRLPEEFVADTVIRLRRRTVGGSMHRTLEIEKARGRPHSSGEHPYSILDGRGSTTGVWENPDEPRSIHVETSQPHSYVQIYYSLQYRNQRIKTRPELGAQNPLGEVASFGITHLDDMLSEEDKKLLSRERKRGLRCGKTSSLIGDAGTGKSALAYSFLCEGYSYYAKNLVLMTEALKKGQFDSEILINVIYRISGWLSGESEPLINQEKYCVSSVAELVNLVKGLDQKARIRVESTFWGKDSNALADNDPLGFARGNWLDDRRPNETSPPKVPLRRIQYPWHWGRHSPVDEMEVADWLLRHPACAYPGVLITTGDMRADDLAARFVQWLHPVLEAAGSSANNTPNYENKLFNYIAQHLICRRLETNDATAPLLFHIIEWSILEAQRMIFGPVIPEKAEDRSRHSWPIRLVMDNLRIIRDMYSAVRDDSLFLPLLTFYLGRDGVTSLIIDTDSGRPDKDPSDETNRELRSLVTQQLYTWQVPFFGQRRIAITVVPPLSQKQKGIIREIRLGNDFPGHGKARPFVDPHFELYSGLEEGRPQAVPLEVRLYAETPAFQEYIRQEDLFFRQVFPSMGSLGTNSDVVVGAGATEYEAIRDYCHMPTDLRLNHSLVFQVDGFWDLVREGSLEGQNRYLTAVTSTKNGPILLEDPFKVFQPIDKTLSVGERDDNSFGRRTDYFQNAYYRRRVWLTEEEGTDKIKERRAKQNRHVDRVPFTWDFGFLLCKIDPWILAAGEELKTLTKSLVRNGAAANIKIRVRDVWKRLPRTDDPEENHKGKSNDTQGLFSVLPNTAHCRAAESAPSPPRQEDRPEAFANCRLDSWRAFLEAACVVAETAANRLGHSVQPFDFAAMSGDSVACLVLEIWFSEIWLTNLEGPNSGRHQLLLDDISRSEYLRPENGGLVELLSEPRGVYETYYEFRNNWKAWKKDNQGKEPKLELDGYSLELYMTWLLLLEVLDFASFEHPNNPFDFRPDRAPVQEAVASRHWYKTACIAASHGERTGHPSELMVAVRLPGHYSVRGDWFLAAAKGSRSARLAERAIDILSSRRANLVRLQAGIGLPTRDVLHKDQIGELRTGLRGPDSKGIIDNVKYGRLFNQLGATPKNGTESQDPPISKSFYWLQRSGLGAYDRHSRPWRRWLNRLFLWTHQYHRRHSSGWVGGFKPYDQLRRGDFSRVTDFESFLEFAKMCDLLIAELKAASPRQISTE